MWVNGTVEWRLERWALDMSGFALRGHKERGTMEHYPNNLAEASSRASILCADAKLTAVPLMKTSHCAERAGVSRGGNVLKGNGELYRPHDLEKESNFSLGTSSSDEAEVVSVDTKLSNWLNMLRRDTACKYEPLQIRFMDSTKRQCPTEDKATSLTCCGSRK